VCVGSSPERETRLRMLSMRLAFVCSRFRHRTAAARLVRGHHGGYRRRGGCGSIFHSEIRREGRTVGAGGGHKGGWFTMVVLPPITSRREPITPLLNASIDAVAVQIVRAHSDESATLLVFQSLLLCPSPSGWPHFSNQ